VAISVPRSRVSNYRADTKGSDQKMRCYYRVKLTGCAPCDPSRQPFVIKQGINDGLIDGSVLEMP